MMKHCGYDFESKPKINYGKGRHMIPHAKVPNRSPIDYYHKTKRGLGYVTPVPSESELELVESFNRIIHLTLLYRSLIRMLELFSLASRLT